MIVALSIPSKQFKVGDLAVTINSRVPLLNDNHVVRIVRVIGPEPFLEIEFGYQIERIDGQNFVFVTDINNFTVPGGKLAKAHHWQLRPLVKNFSECEKFASSPMQPAIDFVEKQGRELAESNGGST
jgi:hypothetical protein